MVSILYRSYAKINLYLEVLRRRRDGYHAIETIFQSVGLADELHFTERASGIALTCSTSELDSGEANLVHRAATLLQRKTDCSQGARIHLEKKIPIAAGLAGGSGNAAATLLALNHLWDLGLTLAELQRLALELGSDVPYCMIGGTMAAGGRGEQLTPLADVPAAWAVLLHPPMAVSASRVYNSPKLRLSGEKSFAGRTASFRRAIAALQRGDLPGVVFNRMEEVVFDEQPHLAAAKQRLIEAGCCAAAMSGSGPTIFGLCASKQEALAAAAAFDGESVSVVNAVPMGLERVQ